MKNRGEEERLLELLEAGFSLTGGALNPITDSTELHMLMYKIEMKAPCGVIGRNAQSLKNCRCSKIGIIISESLR